MKSPQDMPFDNGMLMDLIMMFQEDEQYDDLHYFNEGEQLDSLNKDELTWGISKSFDVDLDKIEKIVKKKLDTNDLVKIAHCAIDIVIKKKECRSL